MYSKNVSTNSGLPVNRARSSGFWVAMPTGQVSRWQTRMRTQPLTTSGAVAKPNSSAPSRAAMTTSRPGLDLPVDLDDDPVAQAVEDERLLGLGQPELPGAARVLEARSAGEAPVPPSWPEMRTTSACALLTPAATVPTPISATSLTWIRACRVGVLEVVDELGEVLDRVDVVVRRRAR